MADFGSNVKKIWLKGMEAIGNTASSIASSTKSRVDEMNLVNRRAEILKEFGNQAYALWLKGERFPQELENQLSELARLDDQLNDLRAERLAGVKTNAAEEDAEAAKETAQENPEAAEPSSADAAEEGTEEAENAEKEDVPVIPVENPVEEAASAANEAIQSLFEKMPTAEEAADRVNSALDALGDGLKKTSDGLDDAISELSDQISGKHPDA
jgi:predicted  nucleic acid-binding Zn-ribbon protein